MIMTADRQKQTIHWSLSHFGESMSVVELAKDKMDRGDIAYWAPEQISYFQKLIPAVDLVNHMDGSEASMKKLDSFMTSLGFAPKQ